MREEKGERDVLNLWVRLLYFDIIYDKLISTDVIAFYTTYFSLLISTVTLF